MFKGMAVNKLKSIIKEKMIDGKLILTEDKLIDLINDYTDNEFKININPKYTSHYTQEYIGMELSLEKK